MHRVILIACAVAVFVVSPLIQAQQHLGYLDQSGYWYTWIDFAPDRIDPVAAKSGLDDLLSDRGLERLEDEVLAAAEELKLDVDAAGFDWREHIYFRWEPHISSPMIASPPAVAHDWMATDFDPQAAGWVRRSEPLQMGNYTGGNGPLKSLMMVRAAYHRANLVLDEPQPMTLDITYRGGVRVFVNGQEVFRGHLPEGEIDRDTRATGYGAAPSSTAFRWGATGALLQAERRLNRSGKVLIDAQMLKAGLNVICIENLASDVHISAMKHVRNYGSAGPGGSRTREFNIAYAHTGINSFRLAPAAHEGDPPKLSRPGGVQVWAGDVHHRHHDVDFLEPGAKPGALRVVGLPNGSYSAVVLVGTDQVLKGLRLEPTDLTSQGGATIPASRLRLAGMIGKSPEPEQFAHTGGHREGVSLRGMHNYAGWKYVDYVQAPALMFDVIGHEIPQAVPAGQTQPVWVTLDIPADARPGVYAGRVAVSAQGVPAVELPIQVEVFGWKLPDPADYITDVWIEQSPYGVAHAMGVELWSEQHWALIRASLEHLARIGTDLVHIPVLQRSEFGNGDDAMIRWSGDPTSDAVKVDLSIMNRYLDLVAETLGQPRVVSVNIMQGGGIDRRLGGGKSTMDEVNTLCFTDGRVVDITEHPHLYAVLAREVIQSMKARGWEKSLHWGLYWDHPPQDNLLDAMAVHAPDVYWARAGHIAGGIHPRVRAQSEVFPSWRDRPEGAMHVHNPRRHSPIHLVEGHALPLAFRILPERAQQAGYTGIGRMGADYWGAWGKGNNIRGGVPDFGVKSLLWPGDGRVYSSQRFEVLREAIQEAEVCHWLSTKQKTGKLPAELSDRIVETLRARVGETGYVPAYFYMLNSAKHYDHPQRWQQRSAELYALADAVQAAIGGDEPTPAR